MSARGPYRVEQVMGMPVIVDVRDPVPESVVDAAYAWLRHVDRTFSTWRDDSEIMRLNLGELAIEDASDDVRRVLARCEELRAETNGYFDAWRAELPEGREIEGAVEPSGLVKGWAVDRAGLVLEAGGARNYSVNAGGDIRIRGAALPDTVWRVGIQHPVMRMRICAVVVANDLAIATSGTYERGEHIVDPVLGARPVGVRSVTITGPDLGTADAYATAAFAMGLDGPAWTAGLSGYEAMTILDDDTVLSTHGFPMEDGG